MQANRFRVRSSPEGCKRSLSKTLTAPSIVLGLENDRKRMKRYPFSNQNALSWTGNDRKKLLWAKTLLTVDFRTSENSDFQRTASSLFRITGVYKTKT